MSSADDTADDELGDGDGEAVVHVADDLEDWLQRERYRDIFEAKRAAAEVLRDLTAATNGPKGRDPATLLQARERAVAVVSQFVIEIKRIFTESERGRELWQNERFGEFALQEVAAVTTTNFDSLTTLNGVEPIQRNGRYIYRITGVQQYRELADTEAMITTTEVANPATGRQETQHERFTPHPPIHVSRAVYEKAADLLGDVGLDLEIAEESEDRWEI